MAFKEIKATALKGSIDIFKANKKVKDDQVAVFEEMLKNDIGEFEFHLIMEQSDPEVIESTEEGVPSTSGLCSFKELSWCFFHGPLPMKYEAGWHLVARSFKAKLENYGDESLYEDALAVKLLLTPIDVQIAAIAKFDDFLDAFKIAVDKII